MAHNASVDENFSRARGARVREGERTVFANELESLPFKVRCSINIGVLTVTNNS